MGIKGWWNNLKSILGLSLSLAKAQFKLRNERSYLGILWYLLEPLLLFFIILYLRQFFSSSSETAFYSAYLLVGLVVFNFFSQATIFSVTSMSVSKRFLISIKIRKESLVMSGFLQTIFSHFFEIMLVIVFFLIFGNNILFILYYPIILVFLGMFTLGICFLLATIGAYVNDMGNVWRVLMRFLWFATPIFYVLKEPVNKIFLINPLYYFLEVARDLIIKGVFSDYFVMCIAASVFSLVIGVIVFNRYKYKFAEIV